LLHSYANPEHEARLAAALDDGVALSVSHRVSRERREFERASTTALNAAVIPLIDRYLRAQEEAIADSFPGAPSFVVHSGGAWVDDVGALRVGPRSAGAVPGPAAYGRGGVEPTVTDADVLLGLQGGVGGGLELNEELAREACARLGSRLGLSAEEAARATVEVAHAQIERALRLVTVRRGHDLRACTLVAYGGAGPMHAGAVALSAGVERVLVPALSSTFSALGCCLSELAI